MNAFDWPTLPLSGARLVEASAGTGKTWAVAALYVRLLLGHGVATTRHQQGALDVRQILVVTYTIAATNELRDRIRARLNELQLRPEELAELALDTGHLARLELALTELDEAQIFTIHGFCQRVLRTFPVECAMPWQWDYVIDDGELWQQACNDFWRREIVALGGSRALDAARLVDAWWSSPVVLNRELARLRIRNRVDIRGGTTPLDEALAVTLTRLDELAGYWREHNVRAAVEAASRIRTAAGKAARPELLDAFDTFAADGLGGVANPLVLLEAYGSAAIGPDSTDLKMRGEYFTDATFLALVDATTAALAELRASILRHAYVQTARLASAGRAQAAQLAPDDLVSALAAALAGPEGALLAQRIRTLWPAAMIDEFQDTDAAQCEIFERIYGQRDDVARIAIGDPKQSIFGFRGADLFSYVDARDQLPARSRYTMQINWRSSAAYLAALNTLYDQSTQPFVAADVEYVPVQASPHAPANCAHGAALEFMWVTPPHARNQYVDANQRCARAAAARVAELVTRGVAPGKIAVIVRNRREAGLIRDALAAVGMRAAYLSREAVLATGEARDQLRVLDAMLDPTDAYALRGALASQMFEADLAELPQVFADDTRWTELVARWRDYLPLWRRAGVLAALHQVLWDHDVAARLLRRPDGARRLTDLRHVAELLEAQAALTPAPLALHRWLGAMVEEPETENEARQLRLESDEALVRVVTVHGAKGLEYDYVMLPYAGEDGPAGSTWWSYFHADSNGRHQGVAALLPTPEDVARSRSETAAEDARLLYVALTRARLQCVVAVCNMGSKFAGSPIGALLWGVDAPSMKDEVVRPRLERLAAECEHIALVAAPAGTDDAMDDEQAAERAPIDLPALPQPRTFSGRIDRSWRVTSYSALTSSEQVQRELPGLADEQADTSVILAEPRDVAAAFPRGPGPGVALHTILERWPEADASGASNTEQLRQLLARQLAGVGLTSRTQLEAAADWLQRVRATPLAPLAVALDGLTDVNHELEFHLRVSHANIRRLREAMATAGLNAAPLPVAELNGLLRGFIDLVFQHDGRFYLVDYKSNWLAAGANEYSKERMDAAIAEHRYDLQYLIYAVALRRYLRACGGAELQSCYGGAFYLFLRGMSGSGSTGIWFAPPDETLLADVDVLFA